MRNKGGNKMKKCVVLFVAFLCTVFGFSGASAVTMDLYDWAFHVDGTVYENSLGDTMPTTGTLTNGLGTLMWSTSVPGSHTFIAFFDHEIDEAINTFFNEYGVENGTPAAGQSWEIDEPGYIFGDIYSNVLAGFLDNSNAVPSTSPDDVSWAMGWDFSLAPGESAVINFLLSQTAPPSGFYLSQTDPDSGASMYLSSNIRISSASVPEPSTIMLLGAGLAGLIGLRKRIKGQM